MQRSLLKLIYLLIFLLLVNSQAKILSASWGDDEFASNNPNVIALHQLPDWQVTINNNETARYSLPLFTSNDDSIYLTNSFEIPLDSIRDEVVFKSLGFNGVIEISINDNLIISKPNSSEPFTISVNKNFLKPRQKNSIKILILKSTDLNRSFPTFTNIYTEPEYIGVTRPFYLEFVQPQLVSDFNYSIQYENSTPDFNYNYIINNQIINSLPKTDGLLLEQKITDEENKTVTSRAIQITKNSNVISGGLSLLPSRFWTPQKPVYLTFTFTLKRYAQPLRSITKKIALRNVKSNKNNILLNNEAIPIRGINYYQNLKYKNSVSLFNRIKADLKSIKNDRSESVV